LITGNAKRGLFDRDNLIGGETEPILSIHRIGPTKRATFAHHRHLSRFECKTSPEAAASRNED
jgi:replicative DNA helicase